jgi:hypothetical protein
VTRGLVVENIANDKLKLYANAVSAVNSSYYGSKAWANQILCFGIQEVKNTDRDRASRLQLIAYFLRLLEENGFWWQFERLKNQVYLGYKNGQFTVSKETDSSDSEEEETS